MPSHLNSSLLNQVFGGDRRARSSTVAVVVFWPAAFFVGGDGPNAAELAQLKGQMSAVEQMSIQKRCNIQFDRGQ